MKKTVFEQLKEHGHDNGFDITKTPTDEPWLNVDHANSEEHDKRVEQIAARVARGEMPIHPAEVKQIKPAPESNGQILFHSSRGYSK